MVKSHKKAASLTNQLESFTTCVSFCTGLRPFINCPSRPFKSLETLQEILIYSVASQTPCGPRANCASASGKVGLSNTVQIRFSPRPLRKRRRVVEACAIMLPPIGLVESVEKAWKGYACESRKTKGRQDSTAL
jgi:hypothetical protein